MIKKSITYTDFNDEEVTEDYYFHYTAAEVAELEASEDGGLSKAVQKIIAEENIHKILGLFKQIVGGAVGKRSEDGKRFVKTEEYKQEFLSSEAYSELFVELIRNPEYAAEFINSLVPKKVRDLNAETADKLLESNPVKDDDPAWLKEGRAPSQEELKNATPEQIAKAFQLKQQARS